MITQNLAKPLLIGATATAFLSCLAGYVWHEQQRPAVLEVYVFALKTGRSMFIRTPDDRRILIDGGGNAEIIKKLTDIIPFYSRRIDAVIVTNTDGKNVSGLIDVVGRYEVERVYIPKFTLEDLKIASSTDQIHKSFIEIIGVIGLRVDEVRNGDRIPLSGDDSENQYRAVLNVLFPSPPETFSYSKASSPEILFSITYGDVAIVFMGDASVKVQKYVANSSGIADESRRNYAIESVLVVSHSASEGNLSRELIDVLRPDFLVYDRVVRADSGQKVPKKSATKKEKNSKQIKADPLASILGENRFNLKEVGSVRIVSDGEGVTIGSVE